MMHKIYARRDLLQAAAAVGGACLLPSAPRAEGGLFQKLWNGHPMGDSKDAGTRHPCSVMLEGGCTFNKKVIEDQCAVRMGIALRKAIGPSAFSELPNITTETGVIGKPRTCRHLGNGRSRCKWHDDGDCHIINATEMRRVIDALAGSGGSFTDIGKPVKLSSRSQMKSFRQTLKGKSGIIYFHRYWGDGNMDVGGGHIDLWSGSLSKVKLELFTGKIENRFSDKAQEIVFWPVV